MQCPQCQHDNPPSQKFCGECGTRLQAVCSGCQTVNPPGQKFCGECGVRLEGAAPPAARAAPPAPTPESYTPRHLAERILTSRAALEGERKQVTVLFADLKGSMELLTDRDPEEARAILDPVLERMMEAVHRYEGTVNQVMGDGIMALFGAPLAHEDHAVRACYAALRMQEAVRQYADEVRWAEGVLIQIRVGLNSGEVVVRSIGSDLRMDYTAVGQTTHLAARMEQLAAPGTILIAPETLRLAEGYVQVKVLGPKPVKGLEEPVEVYEVTGAGAVRSRLQAAAARGLTKFVGRETELEVLRQTLERAAAGRGQVVAAVGEPGVGKSRLAYEFTHSHRTVGWLVLESGSVSYGKATSYLPVIDLLKSYFGIESQDDHRRMREKVLGKLLALDRALEPTLPALLALLDVPVEDAAWEALDPPQRRQRTLDAVKRLLLRESQEQPLLLVFEDLHWIDAETQVLLDGLVDSLPTARILLLVNYRPEYEHTWHRKTYFRELRLDPLPPGSAEALLQALLGDDAGLAPLKRLLVERTEGNPFFLEESVRTLVETSTLAGEQGAYRLTAPLAGTQVPTTVQAVLAARMDRLAPEDKRLLQAAAVIGKDVPYPLLHAIAELPEDALHEGLARLHAAEFLYETSLFPDAEYTFKHALTHEVAYGSLLHERRRALHARIAAAMERLYADRLEERVGQLAHHAFRGESWAAAAAYSQQAATRAAARSAHREAVGYFEQALAALGHLEASHATLRQAVQARFSLRNSLVPLGEQRRILEHLQAAENEIEVLGDRRLLAWAYAYLAGYHTQTSQRDAAITYAERAYSAAENVDEFDLQIVVNHQLGVALCGVGRYEQGLSPLRRNDELLVGDRIAERCGMPYYPAAGSRGQLARYLADIGEFAEATAAGAEAMRVADLFDHPFSQVVARCGLGCVYVERGDWERAFPILEWALDTARGRDFAQWSALAGGLLGYACCHAGRMAEAIPLLEQAVERARGTYASQSVYVVQYLSRAYLLSGDTDRARQLASGAVETARQEGQRRAWEAMALHLLAEIAARADPPEIASSESYYGQARALAEELGMRPLVAHCHLGLGTLYRKIGRHEDAQAELTTAAEMYGAMEMAFWLAKAAAAFAEKAH